MVLSALDHEDGMGARASPVCLGLSCLPIPYEGLNDGPGASHSHFLILTSTHELISPPNFPDLQSFSVPQAEEIIIVDLQRSDFDRLAGHILFKPSNKCRQDARFGGCA